MDHDTWTWLKDEERYLLLLLQRAILRRQGHGLTAQTALETLLQMDPAQLDAFCGAAGADVQPAQALDGPLSALRYTLDQRILASQQRGIVLPVQHLAQTFHLDAWATAILLTLAAAHFSPVAKELLAAVTGTRWQPTPRVGPLVDLIAHHALQRAELLAALEDDAPLLRFRLVEFGPPPEGWQPPRQPPLPDRSLVLAQRARHVIDGRPPEESRNLLQPAATPLPHATSLEELHLDEPQREALAALLPADDAPAAAPPRLWVIGPRGSEVRPLIAAIAADANLGVLWVEVPRWLRQPPASAQAPEGDLFREAALHRLAVVLDLAEVSDHDLLDPLYQERVLDLLRRAEDAADHLHLPLFLHTHRPLKLLRLHASHLPTFTCDFPSPERRRDLWTRALDAHRLHLPERDLARLADAFVLTADDIARVTRTAAQSAQLRADALHQLDRAEDPDLPEGHAPADITALFELCRDDMDIRLQGLTRRIHRPWTVDDIVLQQPQREILEEIIAYASFRDELFEAWGFSRHYATGRGIHCLFSGPPGTGKTMAASVIANALKLPLYRVELSQVVDRYIGETEKRLQQIFDEASRAPCAILFDEADSLFAKRTEVKSSNDRYANLEVNYLLQRLEEFDGVTFLTTNLPGSLDEAFIRRIPFQIAFPEPDNTLTEQLWQHLIPSEVELHSNVDLSFLAKNFEMTGGHIKNVVLRAALKALRHDRDRLTQEDLIDAALVEYAKLGRLPPQSFRRESKRA